MVNAVLWLNPRRARRFAPDMPLADKFKIRVGDAPFLGSITCPGSMGVISAEPMRSAPHVVLKMTTFSFSRRQRYLLFLRRATFRPNFFRGYGQCPPKVL